nr:unnamed protein product [Callosobruchus chinensis]
MIEPSRTLSTQFSAITGATNETGNDNSWPDVDRLGRFFVYILSNFFVRA